MRALPIFVALALLLISSSGHAQIDNAGLLDTVLSRYAAAASTWAAEITSRATWLFWLLVTISMVWTFGFMALRRADLGEFFAEFIRFTIFTGFFWWLLINGPDFANSIILSLRQIGGNATGTGSALSPSGIVDIGFVILDRVLSESSLWSPVDSALGIIIALIILVILALVGINMLLLLISGWVLAYSGIFYLGFGGSRWTSDIAINYFKTVLGIAMQLLTMVLIVGIGQSIFSEYFTNMSRGVEFGEMAVLLIAAIILLVLVNKLPPLIAGVITGASVGGQGIGSFGAGAALGAAGALGAAAAMGGAMTAASAAQASGGAQAIMAAIGKAQENVANGNDILASTFGGGSGGGGGSGSGGGSGGSGGSGGGESPLASAAGFSSGDGVSPLSSATSAASTGQSIGDITADTSPTAPADSAGSGSSGISGSSSDSVEANAGINDRLSNLDSPGSQAEFDPIEAEQAGAFEEDAMTEADALADNSSGGSDQQTSNSEQQGSSSTKSKGVGAALATAGRIAVDAAANLSHGVSDVAKQKASEKMDQVKERVSGTLGGQIASAITERENDPNFSGDSISGETAADAEAEVAAFRDKDRNDHS